jgi:hypothetical protein
MSLRRKDVILAVREGFESIGFEFRRGIAFKGLPNGFLASIDPQPSGRGYTSFILQVGIGHREATGLLQKLSGEKWPLDDALYVVSDFFLTDCAIWSVDHDSPEQMPGMVVQIQNFVETVAMPWLDSMASWSSLVAIEDPRNPDLPYLKAIAYAYYLNEPEKARQILKEVPHNYWEHTVPNFAAFRTNLEQDLDEMSGGRR